MTAATAPLAERDPELVERFVSTLEPRLERYFRPVVRGLERIPPGAGLYVGNHSGGTLMPDLFIWGFRVYRALGIDAVPYALAHDLAIEAPLLRDFLPRLGGVQASPANARRVFAAGHKLLVFPGGDLDSMRSYRDRNRVVFGRRRGYIRLALREDVPIVPVVSAGAHDTLRILTDGRTLAKRLGIKRFMRIDVLPISLSLPWGLAPGPIFYWPMRTRIYSEFLEPIRFDRHGEEAARDRRYVEDCHRYVHRRMEAALKRLAAERERAGP